MQAGRSLCRLAPRRLAEHGELALRPNVILMYVRYGTVYDTDQGGEMQDPTGLVAPVHIRRIEDLQSVLRAGAPLHG